jgi:hypothetical protein
MTTTYNWNCKTVDVYPTEGEYSDVVYNVHWIVTGTSDEFDTQGNPYSVTNIGTQSLSTSDITDFTPISEVTNEEVVEWTKAAIGEEQVENIEASIQRAIDLLINPTSVTMTIGD